MLWNRRDFAKLGAMGLAARYATMMDAEASSKTTRYAVIGLGRIAGHFMRARARPLIRRSPDW